MPSQPSLQACLKMIVPSVQVSEPNISFRLFPRPNVVCHARGRVVLRTTSYNIRDGRGQEPFAMKDHVPLRDNASDLTEEEQIFIAIVPDDALEKAAGAPAWRRSVSGSRSVSNALPVTL